MTNSEPFSPTPIRLNIRERRLTLFMGDLIMSALALLIGLYLWSQGPEWYQFSWEFLDERVPIWFYLLPIIWLLLLVESYDTRHSSNRRDTVRQISIAAVVCAVLYLLVFFLSEPNSLPRRGVAFFIIVAFVLTLLWRLLFIQLFTTPHLNRRVLIIGAGRSGTELGKIISQIWPPPFFTVGYIDDDPEKVGTEIQKYSVLGTSEDLMDIVRKNHVTDLVFAITGAMQPKMFNALFEAEEQGVEITTMPVIYEELLGRVPIFLLQSDWLLRSFVDEAHMGGLFELSKRLMDIIGSLVGLAIFILTFPLISGLIVITSGFPIFYMQIRLGRNAKPFKIIKYRTMIRDAESDGKARPAAENDDRATFIGKILRKMHLDEAPQFINILRGEMSLVGPRSERPEIVAHLQEYIPFYRARLFVKPGLSGWAQVNYGYASGVESNAVKLEYDLYYIKHRTLALDFMIMLRTLGTVVGLRGR